MAEELGYVIVVPFTVIKLDMAGYNDYRPRNGDVISLNLSQISSNVADYVVMKIADKKDGTGKDVTRLRGTTMNSNLFKADNTVAGGQYTSDPPDFLFVPGQSEEEVEPKDWQYTQYIANLPNGMPSHVTVSRLLRSFDYAGRCRVMAEVYRSGVLLCQPEISIPLDRDGDWLPDCWELDNQIDPLRNQVIFDINDPIDTFYDGETQEKVRPIAFNPVQDPPTNAEPMEFEAWGQPELGRYGDGLTAWEEYRGFMINGAYVSTSPHKKDLFAFSNVKNIDGTPLGFGHLDKVAPQLVFRPILESEWNGPYSREINFNRYDGEEEIQVKTAATVANSKLSPQRALFVTSEYIGYKDVALKNVNLGFPMLGYTRGGATTGLDGICQTTKGGDYQVIDVGNGLAHTISILPGLNGIIDPFYAPEDALMKEAGPDGAWYIDMGPGTNSYLHTLTGGYWPPQGGLNDDEVRGIIYGAGPEGKLSADTLKYAKTTTNLDPDGVALGDDIYDAATNTIDVGVNLILDSHNYGGDYVKGIIHGGANKKLSPRLEASYNFSATFPLTPFAPLAKEDADDQWDITFDVIKTGSNGVSNTARLAQGDDIQVIPPGRGQPDTLCIDTDDRDGVFRNSMPN